MLSPAVTSPFVPLSNRFCVALPPMVVRSAVTTPVRVGGGSSTFSRTELPDGTEVGVAEPIALSRQPVGAAAVLRGFGAAALKSEALLFVSTQPLLARNTALVLLGAGVGPLPSKQLAVVPKPARSRRPVGQPVSADVVDTSATLPAVPAMAIAPLASADGSGTPQGEPEHELPAPSVTR